MAYLEDKKFPPLFSYFHQGIDEGNPNHTTNSSIKMRRRLLLFTTLSILLAILFAKTVGLGIFHDEYISFVIKQELGNNEDPPIIYTLGKILRKRLSFISLKHTEDDIQHHYVYVEGITNYNYQDVLVRLKYHVDLEHNIYELLNFEMDGIPQSRSHYLRFISI